MTTLLDALRHIRTNGPTFPKAGICLNVQVLTDFKIHLPRQLLLLWPDKQGSEDFPVEGSSRAYTVDNNKWENPRRIALLEWLIATLEREEKQP